MEPVLEVHRGDGGDLGPAPADADGARLLPRAGERPERGDHGAPKATATTVVRALSALMQERGDAATRVARRPRCRAARPQRRRRASLLFSLELGLRN